MGGTSTIYDVQVRYNADVGRSERALAGLGRTATTTEHELAGLGGTLRTLGSAVAAGAVFGAGKKFLVDYNREMGALRIQMGAMLRSNDLSTSIEDSRTKARGLTDEFQRFAVMTPVTTKELAEFSAGIATATAQTGGSIQDIVTITEQGVVAAKAYGAEAGYAALEITEGLMGAVNKRMRFVRQLITTQHMEIETFNALNPTKRLEVIERALTSPAMKEAAKEFQQSFGGNLSTLEDNAQILLGKAGEALTASINTSMAEANAWVEQHRAELVDDMKTVGSAIGAAFKGLKATFEFIVDHKGAILAVGAAYAAIKLGGAPSALGSIVGAGGGGGGAAELGGRYNLAHRLLGIEDPRSRATAYGSTRANLGMLGAYGMNPRALMRQELATMAHVGVPGIGQIAGMGAAGFAGAQALGMGGLGTAALTATAALSALPGPIGLVASAASLLLIGAQKFAEWVEARNARQGRTKRDLGALLVADAAAGGATDEILQFQRIKRRRGEVLNELVTTGTGGRSSVHLMALQDARLRGIADDVMMRTDRAARIAEEQGALIAGKFDRSKFVDSISSVVQTPEETRNVERLTNAVEAMLKQREAVSEFRSPDVDTGKTRKPPQVNVTIQRIEIASDDPDRFAVGLLRTFARVGRNPGQARNILPGG